MKTESSKNDVTTLPRTNFSGYVRHVTISLNGYCCMRLW